MLATRGTHTNAQARHFSYNRIHPSVTPLGEIIVETMRGNLK